MDEDKEFFNATNHNIAYDEYYGYILSLEDLFEEIWTKHKILVLDMNIKWHEGEDRPSVDIPRYVEQLG